jgi:putative monooxygenase
MLDPYLHGNPVWHTEPIRDMIPSAPDKEDHVEASTQGQIRSKDDVPADSRRGGDVRTLLSPKSVGATSGFMGVATIPSGDWISEHYHPYSEEFLYVVRGEIVARLDGVEHTAPAGSGVFIPINVKHRLMNNGSAEAFVVFHLGPLAPEPPLGHVDTEERHPEGGAAAS